MLSSIRVVTAFSEVHKSHSAPPANKIRLLKSDTMLEKSLPNFSDSFIKETESAKVTQGLKAAPQRKELFPQVRPKKRVFTVVSLDSVLSAETKVLSTSMSSAKVNLRAFLFWSLNPNKTFNSFSEVNRFCLSFPSFTATLSRLTIFPSNLVPIKYFPANWA